MTSRSALRHERREEGQYLLWFAILMPLIFLGMGLVLDGGRLFQGYRQAQLTADLAAQAGSQRIDVPYFQATNVVRLDRGQAELTARSYVLANRQADIELQGITTNNNWITVAVQVKVPMSFMRLLGITEIWVPARSVARPHYGIDQLWQ